MLLDAIPDLSSKSFLKDAKFSNLLLILDAYSKLLRVYGMEKITTEEVMDKLDISNPYLEN